ncbi:hypothetical protein BofuT4_P096760.1 [Botrytis cinerea T4]|uniref:Uncharacterized protein n=1 Tax=Botryotinia fuckeliana (strain T4) TaxID=999810 RepID=G2YCS0_BOTF4|nr:hypothetical protein BofuT4_P096760.1 [Botrytis cinerea T4]
MRPFTDRFSLGSVISPDFCKYPPDLDLDQIYLFARHLPHPTFRFLIPLIAKCDFVHNNFSVTLFDH